jgi:hypothetical protein
MHLPYSLIAVNSTVCGESNRNRNDTNSATNLLKTKEFSHSNWQQTYVLYPIFSQKNGPRFFHLNIKISNFLATRSSANVFVFFINIYKSIIPIYNNIYNLLI